METTPAIAPPTQTAPKEPQVGVPVQAQLDTAQQAGREKKSGQVLQSCRGAHAAASATMLRQLVYDHLGTHPDQDGFTLVTHCKGKTQKKWKPTPNEEQEAAEALLIKNNPKSEKPGEWRKITELTYGD